MMIVFKLSGAVAPTKRACRSLQVLHACRSPQELVSIRESLLQEINEEYCRAINDIRGMGQEDGQVGRAHGRVQVYMAFFYAYASMLCQAWTSDESIVVCMQRKDVLHAATLFRRLRVQMFIRNLRWCLLPRALQALMIYDRRDIDYSQRTA
jgi:hypothetical protein